MSSVKVQGISLTHTVAQQWIERAAAAHCPHEGATTQVFDV